MGSLEILDQQSLEQKHCLPGIVYCPSQYIKAALFESNPSFYSFNYKETHQSRCKDPVWNMLYSILFRRHQSFDEEFLSKRQKYVIFFQTNLVLEFWGKTGGKKSEFKNTFMRIKSELLQSYWTQETPHVYYHKCKRIYRKAGRKWQHATRLMTNEANCCHVSSLPALIFDYIVIISVSLNINVHLLAPEHWRVLTVD